MLWFARVNPLPRSPISGLAIVRSGSACYLFSCDAEWGTIFDTWHATPERAKEQAASQYTGVQMNWLSPGPATEKSKKPKALMPNEVEEA